MLLGDSSPEAGFGMTGCIPKSPCTKIDYLRHPKKEYAFIMKQQRIIYRPENNQDKILAAIIHQVVEAADPDKIILFGSRAMGKQKKDSDYDVCVLKKNIKKRRKLAQRIHLNLNVNASVDVIVSTPYRFNQLKDKWFFIYHDISKYGHIVYEKQ